MPIDRNKMLRYQVLNRCFQDTSRRYRTKDLLECCNREMQKYDLNTISTRTIQKDLQDLQAEPYNVQFDPELKKQYYYRYCDTSYNLELLQLTAPDHDALTRTIDLLRERYSDADEQNPQWQWMLTTLQPGCCLRTTTPLPVTPTSPPFSRVSSTDTPSSSATNPISSPNLPS